MKLCQLLDSYRIFKRLAKALIRLRVCAGCSEALLVAHTTLLEISCRGSHTMGKYRNRCAQSFYKISAVGMRYDIVTMCPINYPKPKELIFQIFAHCFLKKISQILKYNLINWF